MPTLETESRVTERNRRPGERQRLEGRHAVAERIRSEKAKRPPRTLSFDMQQGEHAKRGMQRRSARGRSIPLQAHRRMIVTTFRAMRSVAAAVTMPIA
jgi:hypothetical protein